MGGCLSGVFREGPASHLQRHQHLCAVVNVKHTDENEARMNDEDEDFFLFYISIFVCVSEKLFPHKGVIIPMRISVHLEKKKKKSQVAFLDFGHLSLRRECFSPSQFLAPVFDISSFCVGNL